MLKRSSRLALIVVTTILVFSLSFAMSARPVSAGQTFINSVRFGNDFGYGRINVDLYRQGTGYSFKVTFYYEIWVCTDVRYYPQTGHIDNLRLGVDTCNAAHTQWYHQLYSGLVMLTGVVNQYFEIGGTQVATKYHDGVKYTVYYGTVIFGPTYNPYSGQYINAYMMWGAWNINMIYFEIIVSMNYAELAKDQNALIMDYFRDLYQRVPVMYFPDVFFLANPPWQ